MPPNVTVVCPPSQWSRLSKSVAKAVPDGFPAAMRELYEHGDGMQVTIHGEGVTSTSVLVGLEEMFGGTFVKPPKPLTRAPSPTALAKLHAQPFYERFFDDAFFEATERDGDAAIAGFNLLVRLRLLADIEGESAYLAVDLYGGAAPAIYLAVRAYDAFALAISFEELVPYFAKFGTHRWYYAFLEERAAAALNIDLVQELASSLAGFDDPDVARLTARAEANARRIAEQARASDAHEREEARAAAAEQADRIGRIALSEHATLLAELVDKASHGAGDRLGTLFRNEARLDEPGARDAFVEAVDAGAITLAQCWAVDELVEHLPPRFHAALLTSPRHAAHDRLWRRVDQLFGAGFAYDDAYAALALDPVMRHVVDVFRAIDRGTPEDAARLRSAVTELVTEPPRSAAPRGMGPRPRDTTVTWTRDQLRGLVTAIGGAKGMKLFATDVKAALRRSEVSEAGVMMAVADQFELDDLFAIAMKTTREALVAMAHERSWSPDDFRALAAACVKDVRGGKPLPRGTHGRMRAVASDLAEQATTTG